MSQAVAPDFSTDLSGQGALVTGASSGLGVRFAKVLAACGARVAVAGRRAQRLEQVVREIGEGGGSAFPLPLDMRDGEAVQGAVARAEEGLGLPVSILVNNAGVPDAQRAHRMSLELVDTVLDTNLRGPYLLSCALARRLFELDRPGRIVNVSSIAAFHYGGNGAALYSISKAAIARMTEVLAVEWAARNINVNGIAPGAFESEMLDGMLERMGDISRYFPRKRIGQPHQLDGTLLYLVSPSSECVTGTVVRVDDGQGPR